MCEITLVLMFRSLGAVVFGFISDTYGRDSAYMTCVGLFVVLEISTGFVKTYAQFLGVRALISCAMGGLYDASSDTALENAPSISRSALSGIFLPGYNLGHILAVISYRAFELTPHDLESFILVQCCSSSSIILLESKLSRNTMFS